MSETILKNWVEAPLGDFFETQTGSTPSKKDIHNYGAYIPLVKPPELTGGVVMRAEDGLSELGAKRARVAPAGSVLVSCIGNLGKTAIAGRDIAFNQQINAIYPNLETAYPRFILYQAQSHWFKRQLEAMASATTVSIVNKSKFNRVQIRIAPLKQQHRIADKIDELFSRIDEGERALKAVETLIERYRQSVLKAAVTGELTRDWRESHQHEFGKTIETGEQLLARILKARREAWEKAELEKMIAKGKPPKSGAWKGKYKEPTVPDTSLLAKLPEGWTWATFPQLGDFGRGKSKHRPRNDPSLYGGEYPFLQTGRVANSTGRITEYDTTYNETGLRQSRLWPAGTVCITIAANIAASGILEFDACFPDSVVGLICYEGVSPEYVELFVRTARENLDRYAPATAQKNINLGILEQVAVPLPPPMEQAVIRDRLATIESEISAAVKLKHASESSSHSLRQSILSSAFSGTLIGGE